MAKPQASSPPPPRLCPTCGTRVGELATKCIVCGADLNATAPGSRTGRPRRSFLPERSTFAIPKDKSAASPAPPAASESKTDDESTAGGRRALSIPLPAAIAIIVVIVLMGVALVLGALGMIPFFAPPSPTITPTATVPPTFTPAPTHTETPAPTPSPLPPVSYTVVANDTCISIAFKNNISLQTLLEANGLSQACPLFVGQQITVPQPTYTPTSLPTNTLEPDALTATARPRATYTVAAGDTLFSIAAFYNVDYRAVAEENGIPGPDYSISIGQVLVIPLDRPVPTAGPSPTATALPPYPAPVLLSPPDGAAISAVEQTVVLQWAAVDVLQQSEAYLISVEDLTCNCAKRKVDVTTTTRYIVNVDLKPAEAQPHVFKW
ncbi:MAG: LysM peptidoglycan-binding domain-containing protein, partial [Chloroflexota bacterium]